MITCVSDRYRVPAHKHAMSHSRSRGRKDIEKHVSCFFIFFFYTMLLEAPVRNRARLQPWNFLFLDLVYPRADYVVDRHDL